MSKKLVKTAKQQFEERLKELTLMTSYQGLKDEKLYLCENDHKEMSILRDSEEWGFIEYKYQGGYQSMIDSEEFLYNMVCRFNEIGEPVKYIFDWYASADKDLTPFTVYYIWQCMEYLTQLAFEDLYEEVPDVRIITAKEQWEKDSEGAEIIATQANGSVYKIALTDGSITFFVHQSKEYFREIYLSFDELRKDVNFVMAYLSYVRATHDKDVDYALAWLQGGEYTMSKVSLLDIYEVGECIDHLCYHDKEEPVEKPIAKNEFKEEMNVLREKMVEHIIQLCEQGMTVNVDSLTKRIALGWEDNSFVYTEDIKDLFVKKTENGEWLFCYTSYSNGRSDEYPFKYLSIETLQMFIEAMQ